MNKLLTKCCLATLLLAGLGVVTTAKAGKEKQVYIPMDYSTCGYHASETAIPDVANAVYVECSGGDMHDILQKAIDYVSSLKPDKNGRRGAVLLGAGTFNIDKPLRICASGVVLRGSGQDKTTIIKRGIDRGALLYIEGDMNMDGGDTIDVNGAKVPAGTTTLTLATTKGLQSGDRIRIIRPSTREWIESLGCHDFGGGLDYTGWKPGDIDITWDRTIVSATGNDITIDAPITTTLDAKYGGGFVVTGHNKGEITECGVENMTLASEHNQWNPKDEDHCWDAIWMDNTRDCWVRRVNFRSFAGSAVNIQKNTSRITVEDCIASEPVSEVGGWRRGVFITRGQQTLVQRCVSRKGIHDFAAGFCAAGPNAFVQCEGEESLGFSGSIGSWAAGLLFDIVNIDGNDIAFKNLEQFQFGTGWNTANSMLWQCTGSTLWCYSPGADNRSSANGCWGTLTGNAEWTSSNEHVQPRSLFYAQLEKRVGEGKAINGYILPRSTNATSSPEIEQAQEMARQSLTVPRLTLEMWLDSIPYTASTDPAGVKDIKNVKLKNNKVAKDIAQAPKFAITNGHITADGRLVTGNRYHIPWWAGRVKDSFVKKGAKPAITRFVPGREGLGWTDRIDSVVNYLKANGYCMLDHNYGLWYDLRRTDHERIRRADGNVEAPFYEQPFSRTGKGTAWDGLSRYDLTKPNLWYWSRLKEFAEKGAKQGLMLFHENYFQHNIIEAGAHWVDCPWRPVNNVNGTDFPEPVPFTGDKRIFMAEQFYNIDNPKLRPLHKQYIRQCLENFKDDDNVVQLISEEYTGPLHFTRFWLETIAEWEAETGRHPLIALSCTKDAQDAILADPKLAKVVDIIDIRYWHYNTQGLWAPPAGKNMAPRQFMRKMKVGKTGFAEAYKAVKEYRTKYPDKAVTFFAQQYPQYGWAILMAGGSCPNVPVKDGKFLSDVAKMAYISGEGDSKQQMIGSPEVGYVIYSHDGHPTMNGIEPGTYATYAIDVQDGKVERLSKKEKLDGSSTITNFGNDKVLWLEKL
ncbi:DUF6298 domain-containing protein [Marseilla massiliensis]|uniref:Pectate lyase n=1 Tax=Marseilla massiliensis TaxID=1841864 RepID=A0A939B5C2_9BACT|nr:DUF6298 domain-containing protein [Marseilla massiliensis]MBM6673209.1 pectate lyase [Marseilla massiliensis]